MGIFKFGRGDFFGIIIPGAFLIINIIAFMPDFASQFSPENISENIKSKETIVFTLLFVTSYIAGFALRLIKPDYMEYVSMILLIPYLCFRELYRALSSKDADKSRRFIQNVKCKLSAYSESFPYIDRIFERHINTYPRSYRLFFTSIVMDEFDNNRERMKGHAFINHCKMLIKGITNDLHEELLFREGLIRFLSGMCWAVAFCVFSYFSMATKYNGHIILIYCVAFALFAVKLKHARRAEAQAIFSAYMLCAQKICPPE